jgi:hypothetical protein
MASSEQQPHTALGLPAAREAARGWAGGWTARGTASSRKSASAPLQRTREPAAKLSGLRRSGTQGLFSLAKTLA